MCLGWGRNGHTGPSCPLEIITPTTCSFVSKDEFHVSFQRVSSYYFCQFRGQSYTNILSHEGTDRECHEAKGSVPYSTRNKSPFLPSPLLLCLDRAMTSQPCLILLKVHTWSTVNHTSGTTFNSLPIYGVNTWKLSMAICEGKSWFHLFLWNRLWAHEEQASHHQVVLSTLQDTEQGLQSHLPTWNQMVGNILLSMLYIQEKKIWQIQQYDTWPLFIKQQY